MGIVLEHGRGREVGAMRRQQGGPQGKGLGTNILPIAEYSCIIQQKNPNKQCTGGRVVLEWHPCDIAINSIRLRGYERMFESDFDKRPLFAGRELERASLFAQADQSIQCELYPRAETTLYRVDTLCGRILCDRLFSEQSLVCCVRKLHAIADSRVMTWYLTPYILLVPGCANDFPLKYSKSFCGHIQIRKDCEIATLCSHVGLFGISRS